MMIRVMTIVYIGLFTYIITFEIFSFQIFIIIQKVFHHVSLFIASNCWSKQPLFEYRICFGIIHEGQKACSYSYDIHQYQSNEYGDGTNKDLWKHNSVGYCVKRFVLFTYQLIIVFVNCSRHQSSNAYG